MGGEPFLSSRAGGSLVISCECWFACLDNGWYKFHDNTTYVGGWSEGKLHGDGEIWWANGKSYRGQFKQGKMDGGGRMRYPDGSAFEGLWRENERDGIGKVFFNSTHYRQGKQRC